MQSENDDELMSLVGKSLGNFRIVERIGAGGMATVFKAYQPTLDRYVAVKFLPAYYARDPIFVKRFVQEARSVAKLAHPNIVQIHDFGEQDNITYIVMEYVDGGTLKDRLNQGALSVPDTVDFMIRAAEALDYAHSRGIVHRDVKPANMLLRKDGHLLLSDFGIAKILGETTELTRVVILSPDYLKALGAQSASVSLFRKEVINWQNKLLPICVREAGNEFIKLLESINYIDLAGEDESTARIILLASVRDEGIKLATPPAFPGRVFQNTFDTEPGFPNRQFMTQGRSRAGESDKSTDVPLSRQAYLKPGIKVFFSYSHKDKKLRSELEKYLNHLRRQQLIVGWHDGEIGAGKEWAQEINQHLSEAHIILLLISQDFMTSDYCYDIEMQKALERHESGEAQVIPIILRPAIWENSPIGKLQALPTGARPIIMWSNKELAFMDVAKAIQKAIDKLKDG